MGSWADIRLAFEDCLGPIAGLTVHRVMPATIADKDVAIILYGDPLVVPSAHRNKVNVGIRIIVRVKRGALDDTQDAIDAYLWPSGDKSIVEKVENDPNLCNVIDAAQWQSTGAVGALDDGSLQADINFLAKVTV